MMEKRGLFRLRFCGLIFLPLLATDDEAMDGITIRTRIPEREFIVANKHEMITSATHFIQKHEAP